MKIRINSITQVAGGDGSIITLIRHHTSDECNVANEDFPFGDQKSVFRKADNVEKDNYVVQLTNSI